MKAVLRTVLFLDAVLNLALGVLFLASPWQQLYVSLQIPPADPALYGQLLGVLLVGVAWLQWHATINGQLTIAVARVSGHVNWISGALILAWVLALGLHPKGAGMVFLPALAVVLIVFALFLIKLSHNVHTREKAQNVKSDKTAGSAGALGNQRTEPYGGAMPPAAAPGMSTTESKPSASQDARQNPYS